MSIKVRIRSEYALWKMPASGPDPVSSMIPSQAALQGIIRRKFRPFKDDWLYAKEVVFLKEPRLIPMARNGHSDLTGNSRLQRHMLVLWQPEYLVEYEVMTERDEAWKGEVYNRLKKALLGKGKPSNGSCDGSVCAGESSFVADIEHLSFKRYMRLREQRIRKTFDYGLQYYGLDYEDAQHPKPIMFSAMMADGIVAYPFIRECFRSSERKKEHV